MRTIMRRAFVDLTPLSADSRAAAPAIAQPIPVSRPVESFPSGKPVEMTVMFGKPQPPM